MRRGQFLALGMLLFLNGPARAQSSLDTLVQELDEAKQLHQDTSAQALSNFFSQVDAAMASPDAAVQLYQQAGGVMPDPTAVTTQYETESASEKEARLRTAPINWPWAPCSSFIAASCTSRRCLS